MLNIRELKSLRTKEELINYFKAKGKNITEEEIEALKKSYEQAEENGNTLTMQQLDDVAGGGLYVRVHAENDGTYTVKNVVQKGITGFLKIMVDNDGSYFLKQGEIYPYQSFESKTNLAPEQGSTLCSQVLEKIYGDVFAKRKNTPLEHFIIGTNDDLYHVWGPDDAWEYKVISPNLSRWPSNTETNSKEEFMFQRFIEAMPSGLIYNNSKIDPDLWKTNFINSINLTDVLGIGFCALAGAAILATAVCLTPNSNNKNKK